MRIAILGAGAWGTALAISLSARHSVTLWARRLEVCTALRDHRFHPHTLPGITLPAQIQIESDFTLATLHADLIVISVAVAGVRSVLDQLAACDYQRPVILACKGFEQGSEQLPHVLAQYILGSESPVFSLSGPSFASEVAQGKPTALVLAGEDGPLLSELVAALHHSHLRIYSNDDPTGVELAGALKNVIAIAAGMCDGMGLGLNARAALITRGLAEIRRLGKPMGAKPETFLGLAGLGDLMLTCTAPLSRNYRVGQGLAKSQDLQAILSELGEVAEGVSTARALRSISARVGVEMPICAAVLAVIEGHASCAHAMTTLLERDPRSEAQ
jgi:glycerol-3-phosphate dehydrogenase (NAD(P)+)